MLRSLPFPAPASVAPAFGEAVSAGPDGRFSVLVRPPLGRLSTPQREALAAIARAYAFAGLAPVGAATWEVRGVDPELVPTVVDAVHGVGLPVAGDR
jgi:dissimilatory sulfite reductase (desulfoviridin) alpha/beta subunit